VSGLPLRLALVVLMLMPARGVAQGPAWPDEAYRVEWEEVHVPPEGAGNMLLSVPLTLRNTGNKTWPASAVVISYHWIHNDKLVVWDGVRTALPRDLRAGGRATVAARVKTPAAPGSYLLQITLVHENVVWFEHKGANTFVQSIVVTP
jgi:hypothetical protein